MVQDLLEVLIFALACVVLGTIIYQLGRIAKDLVLGRTKHALELLVGRNLLRPRGKDLVAIICFSILAAFIISAFPGIYEGGISNRTKQVRSDLTALRESIINGAHPETPRDLFSRKGAPYSMQRQGTRWLVASVGPDGIDQIAALNPLPADLTDQTYDPTNGTGSAGDIWLEAEAASH
jgi:hypothetical protein